MSTKMVSQGATRADKKPVEKQPQAKKEDRTPKKEVGGGDRPSFGLKIVGGGKEGTGRTPERQSPQGGRQGPPQGGRMGPPQGGRQGPYQGGRQGPPGGRQGPPHGRPGPPQGQGRGGGPRPDRQDRGPKPQPNKMVQENNSQHPPVGQDKHDSDNNSNMQPEQKKFTGRCRLFVGNLPNDTSEDDFRKMFTDFGELSELYLNTGRGFGFVRLDTRANAEAAKAGLDGTNKKGRFLRVRFATHGAAIKVKHMSPFVSNEVLEQAFSQFGSVERAIVIVDDRGKPTGEGIVEFARKPGALAALKRINEGVFMLTSQPRPIVVEPLEQKDEEDGLPEKFMSKGPQLSKERDQPPRFAGPGSFEFDFGGKWKELYKMHEEQIKQVHRQFEDNCVKLEDEMGAAMHEHTAMLMRQDLMRRSEELRRMEEQAAAEKLRRADIRRREEEARQMQEERHRQEMMNRQQEEEMRRREMQERRQHQEEAYAQERERMRDMRGERGGNAPPMQPPPAPPAGLGIDRTRQQNKGGMQGGMGGGSIGANNVQMGGSGGGMGVGGAASMGSGAGEMQGNMGQMRSSRFDQEPQGIGGGYGNSMGGSPGMGTMGGGGGATGGGMGGHNNREMGRMGSSGTERLMDRNRERPREEPYFESKRPRRY